MSENNTAAPAAAPAAKLARLASPETLAKRSAAFREKLAQATAGAAYPSAGDGMAWFALIGAMPAVQAAVAAAIAGKYKSPAKVENLGDMFANTKDGNDVARDNGAMKKDGKPTAHGATAIAIANACKALATDKVCRGAVIFFMLTDKEALAAFHASKASKDNGKPGQARYLDGTKVPCPAYCNGYLNGNVRKDLATKS